MFSHKFLVFAAISGTGWLIDVTLIVVFVALGFNPFVSACMGALITVTMVFFVSQFIVFDVGERIRVDRYPYYLVWHGITIPVASALIAGLIWLFEPWVAAGLSWLDQTDIDALVLTAGISKASVTPLTLTANFFFTRWLVEHRVA